MTSQLPNRFQRLADSLRNGWSFVLDHLLPASCRVCGREGHWWCADRLPWPQCFACHASYHPEGKRLGCRQVSLPLLYLGQFKKNPDLRTRLYQWKYGGYWALSADWGQALAELVTQHGLEGHPLVPIPIHPSRWRARGFHQTQQLAEDIARGTRQPIHTDVLMKEESTPHQARQTSRDERIANLLGSYRARSRRPDESAEILLVDDVVTSGATVLATRRVLKEAGWDVRGIIAVATDR